MQMLPRGYRISEKDRITKVISSGDEWQIYSTNREVYVLAVTSALYNFWHEQFDLPDNLFSENPEKRCYTFVSGNNYLVSSLEYGPYPDTYVQIEAFSSVFARAVEKYPRANWSSAIYVEQFSLIMPSSS